MLLSLLLIINFHVIYQCNILKSDCSVISLLLLNFEIHFQEILVKNSIPDTYVHIKYEMRL